MVKPLTPFVHAEALLAMWDTYDRSPRDAFGAVAFTGYKRLVFLESLAVVTALSRIAVAKGVLTDDEGKEAAR